MLSCSWSSQPLLASHPWPYSLPGDSDLPLKSGVGPVPVLSPGLLSPLIQVTQSKHETRHICGLTQTQQTHSIPACPQQSPDASWRPHASPPVPQECERAGDAKCWRRSVLLDASLPRTQTGLVPHAGTVSPGDTESVLLLLYGHWSSLPHRSPLSL